MAKQVVVVPGLTPEWIRKRSRIMKAIDEQLALGLEKPGAGLTLDQLQLLNEHRNPFPKKAEALVPVPLKYDKTKDGWTKLEDIPFYGQPFDIEIVEFLKPGESIHGEMMKQRAIELNAHLGQGHAEYLLENQHKIPKELQGKYLVFPGTVWRDSNGDRRVPYLDWSGGRLYLCFSWLRDDWSSNVRLICLCK